ncbi:MAG: hypothetical protein H7317_07705 [Pseudorhodobacter sp.]|nr:hypothetical protein [Pseudorhodobacter sp.]
MTRIALLSLLALTACGAGGPPLPPTTVQPGITLSGSATMGIARNGTN